MLSACPLDARTSYQVSSALNELSEFLITANGTRHQEQADAAEKSSGKTAVVPMLQLMLY